MIKYIKNLFKKKPIVQQTLNLGKLTATVEFKDLTTFEKRFTGDYDHSSEFTGFGNTIWIDDYTTAEKKFQNWFAGISERKFIKINDSTFLPISDIVKITTKSECLNVETRRGQ